ncbi:CoA transferase [bacterium]|nr:CoA transferase [bacterium]
MLQGIRVIEHATYYAAPAAGAVLADWGADVIKIEPPGGDPVRKSFPTRGSGKEHLSDNPSFDFTNRGKKGVVLDARTEDGREAIRRLADTADVFLTNVRPGGIERSGLDYETLSARNPRLVYCALTGYGLEGPDANRPGFDIAAFWSRTGLARLTAPKGTDLFPVRTAAGDLTTSITAVAAINAALIEASRTGKGRLVDVSLLRAGLFTIATDFSIQLFFDRIASTRPRHEPYVPTSNFFRTRDDHWICLVARVGEVDVPRIARAFGVEEILSDERFQDGRGRHKHSAELTRIFDEACARFTRDELAARMDAEELAWAPCQTLGEVAADPQVIASGAIIDAPSKTPGETYRSPAGPVRFVGVDDLPKGRPPEPGEHTREVLASVGYSPAEIDGMLASGAAIAG